MRHASLHVTFTAAFGGLAVIAACSSTVKGTGSGTGCSNDYSGRWSFSGACTHTTCDVSQKACSLVVHCDDGTQGTGTVSGTTATLNGLLGSGDSGSCNVTFNGSSLTMQCSSSRSTQPCTSSGTCSSGSCGAPFPSGGSTSSGSSGASTVPCKQKAGADTDPACAGQPDKPRKLDCDAADTQAAIDAGCAPTSPGNSDVCCPLTVSGTPATSSSSGGADAAPTPVPCLATPPRLFAPVAGAGPYCQFAPTATASHCAVGEKCCLDLASSVRSCGASCPTSSTVTACYSAAECPQGMVCCGKGVADTTSCNYLTMTSYTGSICSTACRTGEYVACAGNAECGGKTCTPGYVLMASGTAAMQIGVCR